MPLPARWLSGRAPFSACFATCTPESSTSPRHRRSFSPLAAIWPGWRPALIGSSWTWVVRNFPGKERSDGRESSVTLMRASVMELVEHVLPDIVFLQPRERLTVENEADLKAVVIHHLHAGRVRL